MNSRTQVSSECKDKINQIDNSNPENLTLGYLIMMIGEQSSEWEVEKEGSKDATYEDFKKELLKEERHCRVAAVWFQYQSDSGEERTKLVVFYYQPVDADVKETMVYLSGKTELFKEKGLKNASRRLNVSTSDDLEFDVIRSILLHGQ